MKRLRKWLTANRANLIVAIVAAGNLIFILGRALGFSTWAITLSVAGVLLGYAIGRLADG